MLRVRSPDLLGPGLAFLTQNSSFLSTIYEIIIVNLTNNGLPFECWLLMKKALFLNMWLKVSKMSRGTDQKSIRQLNENCIWRWCKCILNTCWAGFATGYLDFHSDFHWAW